DGSFQIPANADYTHETYCTVPKDLNIVLQLGHMHEHGSRFIWEIVDDADNQVELLRDDAWAPEYASHPPITTYPLASPLVLTKGMRLRQACQWHNSSTETLEFPREMCVGFGYYYPEDGEVYCPSIEAQ